MLQNFRTVCYGYESLTELTELSGMGIIVLQNSQNLSGTGNTRVYKKVYPTEHSLEIFGEGSIFLEMDFGFILNLVCTPSSILSGE